MRKHLLLFDIDGTMMTCRGAGMRAMAKVAARLFGDNFKWEGISAAGHLDPLIFAEAATLNALDGEHSDHHAAFHDHYIEELEAELIRSREAIEVMPGVHDVLEALRRRVDTQGDIVLGLLTGNYSAAAPLKLASIAVDVNWFTITAFGDEATSRPGLVELAMRKYRDVEGEPCDPSRVIVIGDTPRDIDCAHAHGCVAFAVATGGFTIEQLAEHQPEVVVASLQDPAPLYTLLP